MPADETTWAISPPMVPAPTTAALNTNMAARLQGRFLSRLRREARERAPEHLREGAPDEEDVGHGAERAALLQLVVELDRDERVLVPDLEGERLRARQLLLEDLRGEATGRADGHALGDAP